MLPQIKEENKSLKVNMRLEYFGFIWRSEAANMKSKVSNSFYLHL